MKLKIQNTNDASAHGAKILAYGQSGEGKTWQIRTLPRPILLSVERRVATLAGAGVPYVQIGDAADLADAIEWAKHSAEASAYDSIAIDSLSEVAEMILIAAKSAGSSTKEHGMRAYGTMGDDMAVIIRELRDLPEKHVYCTAKLERTQDEMGKLLWGPGMPGKQLGPSMPYFFDYVFAIRQETGSDGSSVRVIQTGSDGKWCAKDCSGKLDHYESAEEEHGIGGIIRKIKVENND